MACAIGELCYQFVHWCALCLERICRTDGSAYYTGVWQGTDGIGFSSCIFRRQRAGISYYDQRRVFQSKNRAAVSYFYRRSFIWIWLCDLCDGIQRCHACRPDDRKLRISTNRRLQKCIFDRSCIRGGRTLPVVCLQEDAAKRQTRCIHIKEKISGTGAVCMTVRLPGDFCVFRCFLFCLPASGTYDTLYINRIKIQENCREEL